MMEFGIFYLFRYPDFSPDLSSTIGFNPFKIDESTIQKYFCESLPPKFKELQWAIDTPDKVTPDKSTRGNESISKRNLMPSGFNQLFFNAFGNLRFFPNQQIRKLVTYLREGSLVLDNECVVTLIRMALYNIGEIDSNGVFLWKTDCSSDCNREENLLIILNNLQELANNLRPKL